MHYVVRYPGFLGNQLCSDILDFAIDSEANFKASVVGAGSGEVNPDVRRSLRLPEFGELQSKFESRLRTQLPTIISQLGLMPFTLGRFETELVAHLDAGFYDRHSDTFTGEDRSKFGDRVISCVYYFCDSPKQFAGGELKLYPLPTSADRVPVPIVITPENDLLVAFSSWEPHEVLPVRSQSSAFRGARFSVNCWVYSNTTLAPTGREQQ